MEKIVQHADAGRRLDTVVQQYLPLSRAFVKKLCEEDRILVNSLSAKAGHKLHLGDKVLIKYDISELENIPVIDLPILYEDDDCIVIYKPAGLLSHSASNYSTEATVATFLRNKVRGLGGGRAGLVHRLDRATSGVMVGAKSAKALSFLQKQFSNRKVEKTYVAAVSGHLHPPEAVVDMPIERNPKAPSTFRVGPNGKPAVTHYRVLAPGPQNDLVELKPETGRTHQLRVHMAKLGHPILGDPLYGTGVYGDRLFLHAKSLKITLPNGQLKLFNAPLPKEFERQL